MRISASERINMGFYFLVLVCAVLSLGAVTTFAQPTRNLVRDNAGNTEKRVALVIGNAAYQHAPRLGNPVNDARDIAAALRDLGFDVLYGEDQNADQMKRLIKDFGAKLLKGSKGLFYYAGHGIQLNGRNYLVPVEIDSLREATIEFDAVDLNRVLAEMDAAGNGFNIVILDACRNNPFTRSWRDTAGGLASISAPTGTFIAYSTAPNSVASDGTGRNGLYTQELLKQLRTPDTMLEEVFKQVRTEVRKRSNNQQVPWESSSVEGVFYFSGNLGRSAARPGTVDAAPAAGTAPGPVAAQFDHWNSMLKRREGPAVIQETTAKLKLDPQNAVALRMRSFAYTFDGKDEPAKADAEATLRIIQDPSNVIEYEARCWAFYRLEKNDEAIPECTRAIQLNAGFERAYATRGNVYSKKHQYELALADFSRVIEFDPKFSGPYGARANVYFEMQRYDEAIAGFTKAIELDPAYPPAYHGRAGCYVKKQQYELALADFNKAIQLNPKEPSIVFDRGVLYLQTELYDRAIPDFTKATELNPKFALAYFSLGVTYIYKQQYDAAISSFSKAIEQDPKFSGAYNMRGLVYDAQKKQADLALLDFNRAIDADLKNPDAYSNRGNIYYNKGQVDLAIADYTKAIELKPSNKLSYFNRGNAYKRKMQHDLAIADFTKTIELDPNYVDAYRYRAGAYEARGDTSLAAADRQKVKDLESKPK